MYVAKVCGCFPGAGGTLLSGGDAEAEGEGEGELTVCEAPLHNVKGDGEWHVEVDAMLGKSARTEFRCLSYDAATMTICLERRSHDYDCLANRLLVAPLLFALAQ